MKRRISERSIAHAREARLRRLARRHGYMVAKSRVRNPNAASFGTYAIIDPATNAVVHVDSGLGSFGLSLDDLEAWLNRP
ncbi:MAG: hypothetical protein ACXWNG_02985 [Candidatus Limnocylindrales bacterium]